MPGVSFDRATEYYDATRGLPAPVRDKLADVLSAELAGRGTCLEIGAGTGRIALPLHGRGVALVGIDLSVPMLRRLIANAGGRPFPVLAGDATSLPFRDGSVDAVVASHVLHLIPDWHRAVDEARRVLTREGSLLVDFGGGTPAPWSEGVRSVLEANGVFHVRPGVSDERTVADYLGPSAVTRPLPAVSMTVRRSLARDLHDFEHQLHAWTWDYEPDHMAAACGEVRRWAESSGWNLNAEVDLERVIQWWAFEAVPATGRSSG